MSRRALLWVIGLGTEDMHFDGTTEMRFVFLAMEGTACKT